MSTTTIVRPMTDEGELLGAAPASLAAEDILKRTLPSVTKHLDSVAWWPAELRGEHWQVGDFAFYILEFGAGPGATLYVQVWSEPDESVLVEVSSGIWNPPAAERIPAPRREALLNRGFGTGGRAGNFRKLVQLERRTDCRMLARELLGVLTECLGYDGRAPLSFRRHLGSRTRAARVFDSLTFDDLGRLLRASGFTAERVGEDNRRTWRSTAGFPFIATLQADDDEAGESDGFALSTYASLPPGTLGAVEQDLRGRLPFARVSIDANGDLSIAQIVYIGGGVTEGHIRQLLEFWRGALEVAHQTIQRHQDSVDVRALN